MTREPEMSVDDILFQPINQSITATVGIIDQGMIDAVNIALSGTTAIEFIVDPDIDVATYDTIADFIVTDPQVVKYTTALVNKISVTQPRPAGSLTIKDVFRRIHSGHTEFYFCARANGAGISKYEFTNWFGIDSGVPLLHVDQGGYGDYFEWWLMGVMPDHVGYNQYYCFGDWSAANKYYGIP